MPMYHRLGDVPRKRHIQFRDNGTLLTEEVMGLEGFSGNESILYHLQSPCRLDSVGDFRPIVREEWIPDAHVHRLADSNAVAPDGEIGAFARERDDIGVARRPLHDLA